METELVSLREEVVVLREENGTITITEPGKIHAIRLETDCPLTWKWRVYVPEGRKVVFRHQAFEIPKDAFCGKVGMVPLSGPAEVVVVARIEKCNSKYYNWRSVVSVNGGSCYNYIPPESSQWLETGTAGFSHTGVGRSVAVEKDEGPFLLHRRRNHSPGAAYDINELEDGLIVWISNAIPELEH